MPSDTRHQWPQAAKFSNCRVARLNRAKNLQPRTLHRTNGGCRPGSRRPSVGCSGCSTISGIGQLRLYTNGSLGAMNSRRSFPTRRQGVRFSERRNLLAPERSMNVRVRFRPSVAARHLRSARWRGWGSAGFRSQAQTWRLVGSRPRAREDARRQAAEADTDAALT